MIIYLPWRIKHNLRKHWAKLEINYIHPSILGMREALEDLNLKENTKLNGKQRRKPRL